MTLRTSVIIPALDEEEALPRVLTDLRGCSPTEIVVVDNGSRDRTALVAEHYGARVVMEPQRGYGAACLAGIRAIRDSDVVVFVDADYSDDPRQLPELVAPIEAGHADLVIGSRELGEREALALPPHARFGNWLATSLIERLYGVRYTDLGPFRAIRWSALLGLGMSDEDFGWTVEMQILAAKAGLRIVEVPVRYRRRMGKSKISGTLAGSARAGGKILYTLGRCRSSRPMARAPEQTDVSIVIPTLDEIQHLPGLISRLIDNEPPFEIIVVDGGSTDGTLESAHGIPGVRCLSGPKNRAAQQNLGAKAARAPILWFLHADCLPRKQALREIRRAIGLEGVAAGAFRFQLDSQDWRLRLVEAGVRIRAEHFGFPYGDQGIFTTARAFAAAGGFPEVALLEDLRLVEALRRLGRIDVVPSVLLTSARRWETQGVLSTTLWNSGTFLLHRLGVPEDSILHLRDLLGPRNGTRDRCSLS